MDQTSVTALKKNMVRTLRVCKHGECFASIHGHSKAASEEKCICQKTRRHCGNWSEDRTQRCMNTTNRF